MVSKIDKASLDRVEPLREFKRDSQEGEEKSAGEDSSSHFEEPSDENFMLLKENERREAPSIFTQNPTSLLSKKLEASRATHTLSPAQKDENSEIKIAKSRKLDSKNLRPVYLVYGGLILLFLVLIGWILRA